MSKWPIISMDDLRWFIYVMCDFSGETNNEMPTANTGSFKLKLTFICTEEMKLADKDILNPSVPSVKPFDDSFMIGIARFYRLASLCDPSRTCKIDVPLSSFRNS